MSTMLLEIKDLCKYYGSGDNLVKAIDHTHMLFLLFPGDYGHRG